jgi:hypothetical protein
MSWIISAYPVSGFDPVDIGSDDGPSTSTFSHYMMARPLLGQP